jgi:GT2 family glycosyltransferase
MSAGDPRVSVVITAYNARGTIAACLDSLRRQETRHPFEILLVESSADGTAELVRRRYPEVRLIESAHRLHCGDARNRALELTRAAVIAFLDADCLVDPVWIDALCDAHGGGDLLVGGAIDNASRRSLVGWAYYFCEYSLWLPARTARRIPEIAGCCLSMKRVVYDRFGPFLEGTYSSDTAFQWKAAQAGEWVLYRPEIRVHHDGPSSFRRFIGHTYEHRRAYARVRAREKRMTAARRLAEMALLPLTPLLLMGAALLRLRRCPRYLPYYLACAPVLFTGYCARACGEFAGYWRP